ncbi:hypothetical protein Bbelb_114980 [Branchiostoma belcheri]|nr:hypothetical protein Bbelb_114980 [Branchiostoma belcheri]
MGDNGFFFSTRPCPPSVSGAHLFSNTAPKAIPCIGTAFIHSRNPPRYPRCPRMITAFVRLSGSQRGRRKLHRPRGDMRLVSIPTACFSVCTGNLVEGIRTSLAGVVCRRGSFTREIDSE